MVKVKRDQHFVWPDRYYIWSYFPEKYRSSVTKVNKSQLYKKHYTCIPFFTRRHAKHVVCFYHGVKALHFIHIISGKKLIKQGITTFNKANGQKKYNNACFIKSEGNWYPAVVRQWVYPPEYHMDSHRRRHYIVTMNRAFENHGKVGFNRKYELLNQGNSYRRVARWFFKMRVRVNRQNIYTELKLLDILEESRYPITIIKSKQGYRGFISREPITLNSKEDVNTLLDEVKQFNNDPRNQRMGTHIVIKSYINQFKPK